MAVILNIPELDTIFETIESMQAEIRQLKALVGAAKAQEWFNIEESAVFLNCSTKTVRRHIKAGFLKISSGMRNIRIHREELERYRKLTTYGKI